LVIGYTELVRWVSTVPWVKLAGFWLARIIVVLPPIQSSFNKNINSKDSVSTVISYPIWVKRLISMIWEGLNILSGWNFNQERLLVRTLDFYEYILFRLNQKFLSLL